MFLVNFSFKYNLQMRIDSNCFYLSFIDTDNLIEKIYNFHNVRFGYDYLRSICYCFSGKTNFTPSYMDNYLSPFRLTLSKKCLIIDSNLVRKVGFADRIRGILSVVQVCRELNIDYYINFTAPFNLNKYLIYQTAPEYIKNLLFKKYIVWSSLGFVVSNDKRMRYSAFRDFVQLVNSHNDCFSLGTNLDIIVDGKEVYLDTFKKTSYFKFEYDKYKSRIPSEYISISFRFLNLLGDFNEPNSIPLPPEQQNLIIEKCKNELLNFMSNKKFNGCYLILSDSFRFLNSVKGIPRVIVFPENITHIASISSTDKNAEVSFLKTLIDFNLILDAVEIYRFESSFLRRSGFPYTAALCSGKKMSIHQF